MEQVIAPLPPVPDHPRLEEEILQWWEDEQVFQQLRDKNHGGPKFSFMDGPITANAPAGVHHGLGRTLKDVFQRYKALRGHDLRYQNGFDSQGLHVEVQVEKGLGLNSKREIEEYGIGEFARRCREFVAHFAGVQTEQSKRLGMWMDWDNSYFTFSDTNIEYIWRFLKNVHDRGWLYMGHRSTQWCPRCGTSLSKHEQAGDENYEELEHPSLFVRFPLVEREGEALVIWTTTPWTLPARLGRVRGSNDGCGRRAGAGMAARARAARRGGDDPPPLSRLLALPHAARFPRRRRLVHLGRRDPAVDAGRQRRGRLAAPPVQEADGRLAAQHGRLEHLAAALLRAAAAVLSLRLRTAERDRLARGARRARGLGARRARGAAPALDRRGDDPLRGLRRRGDAHRGGRRRPARRGHRSLLDARVAEPRVGAGGERDRRSARRDARRSAGPCVLGEVVPGRLGVRGPSADPPLVLLTVLHGDGARRPAAVPERPHLREPARRDRPRDAQALGECDRAERGARPHGRRRDALAVLRAKPEPGASDRLLARGRRQAMAAHLLELGLILRHVREHRRVRSGEAGGRATSARRLAHLTYVGVRERGDGELRALLDARRHRRVRALRRRSVELVHPAVATTVLGRRRDRATCAVGGPANVAPGDRAGDAVPRRAALAEPRAEGEVGFPRGLA